LQLENQDWNSEAEPNHQKNDGDKGETWLRIWVLDDETMSTEDKGSTLKNILYLKPISSYNELMMKQKW
jgi:hypothetical protein